MSNGNEAAGEVKVEGKFATLLFERRFDLKPERVWKAITDPEELSRWYMTKAKIEGGENGSVEFISGPSRLHVTGNILVWDPPRVFEHEWKIEPRQELPKGENAVIRWELRPEGNATVLILEHRNLSTDTAKGFAPGTHAFLDRLEAHLNGKKLPNWQERYKEVAGNYPSSWLSDQ